MAESSPLTDLASLVAEHHAVLYRYALRLSGSTADAEDLTQQTFLTAQASLAGLRNASSARAWLFTVLRNGYLKSRRRPPPLPAADLDLDINAVSDPASEDLNFWEQNFWENGALDQAIDPERLQLALDELPPDFKIVVLMFYFEECSYKQIAEQLALPIGTVMSRLSRAKQHLRKALLPTATATATATAAAAAGKSHRSTLLESRQSDQDGHGRILIDRQLEHGIPQPASPSASPSASAPINVPHHSKS